jgi:hypothetical protein
MGEGQVRRVNAVLGIGNLNPKVALTAVAAGTVGGFAARGSVATVQVDAGAVAVGDQLVPSDVSNGRAKADNANRDPRLLLGIARTSKAAGAPGSVKADL